MWTKMWVDDSGQVLKVTTSLGLEMLSDGLADGTEYQAGRQLRRSHRKSKRMILTEHLTKKYGGLVAVNDLNLDIPQGQFFAFLGPNGAGKTTTIKLLAGLLKPVSGRALIGGYDIQKNPVEARKDSQLRAGHAISLRQTAAHGVHALRRPTVRDGSDRAWCARATNCSMCLAWTKRADRSLKIFRMARGNGS